MSFTILQSPNTYAASNNYMWNVVKSTRKPDWNYIDNQCIQTGVYTGYLMYSGTTAHGFKVGDYIYVTQNAGYAFEGYGGSKQIINIPNTKQIIVNQKFTYSTPVNPGTIQYQPPLNYYIQFAIYNADTLGSPIIQNNIKTYPTVNNGTAVFDSHKVLNNYVSYDTNILSGKSDFYISQNMIYKYCMDYYEYTGATLISQLTGYTYGYVLNAVNDRNNNFDFSTFQMNTGTKGRFLSPWINSRSVRYDDRCSLSYLSLNGNTNYAELNLTGSGYATYYLDNAYNYNTTGYTNNRILNLGCGPYEIENSSLWYGYYSRFSAITFVDSIAGNPPNFTFTFNPYFQIVTGPIVTSDIGDFLSKIKTIIESYTGFTCVTAVTSTYIGTLTISAPTYYYGTTMTITNTAMFPMFVTSQSSVLNTTNTTTKYFASNILTNLDATNYSIQLKNVMYNQTSEIVRFNIDTDCKLTDDEIQIIWLNSYGGFDSYTFYRQINKIYKRNVTTYRKNDYSFSNNKIQSGEYDFGNNILSNSIYENYKVKSKWLSNDMSKNVTSLFLSSNVFARINNTIYSIVVDGDSIEVINNKNRDKAIYEFEFELSNQNNTQMN